MKKWCTVECFDNCFWLECLNGLQDGPFCRNRQKPKTHIQYWDFFIYTIEFQLFEGSEYHNKYNWSYWFINKSIFFDVLIKTFYSFKFKFSRVRLDKHIHWQDFKRSMLKKPKLVIFKVSYYHNHFQWRLRLLNFTLSFTIDKIFWASLPILPKRHAQSDQSDIQARMNELFWIN